MLYSVIVAATLGLSIAGTVPKNPADAIRGMFKDIQYEDSGAKQVSESSSSGVTTGSLVFSYYGSSECSGSATNAVGYVLGGCVSGDGATGAIVLLT
jgi:hypothetical protein